jgi:hypothetical protein
MKVMLADLLAMETTATDEVSKIAENEIDEDSLQVRFIYHRQQSP